MLIVLFRRIPNTELFSETRRSQRNGCVFCLQNGEDVDLAESHVMRHPLTKEIICPVLKEKP